MKAIALAVPLGLAGCSAAEPSESDSDVGSGGASGNGTAATTAAGSTTNGQTATNGTPTSGTSGQGDVNTTGSTSASASTTGGSGGGNPSSTSGANSTGGSGGDGSGGNGGNTTGGTSSGGNGAGGASSTATATTGPHVVGETGPETLPGNGCTPPAAYGNLFMALSGHTQEDTDAKLAAAWNQLYNPSNQNTVYYDGPGADESYVKDTGNNDVRSEGMSYGMMTAVQLDKQTEFDRLWTWVINHMKNGTNEISWQCSTSGQKMSNGGAPDGEEYMATALIFAHNRWGSTGKYDYASEAQWVLDLIRTKYFNEMYHLVKFVSSANYTDGSYILPAFYQVWACFDSANADFWNEAITAGREFFHVAAGSNGVVPDFSEFDGRSRGSAGSDAKRVVMNIMMDHNFFAADPWQTETYAPAFGNTMRNGGDNTAAQFSCNALLGFGLPEADGKTFVDRLWTAQIPSGQWRYYDGTLYMLGLLHVAGAFKLYY